MVCMKLLHPAPGVARGWCPLALGCGLYPLEMVLVCMEKELGLSSALARSPPEAGPCVPWSCAGSWLVSHGTSAATLPQSFNLHHLCAEKFILQASPSMSLSCILHWGVLLLQGGLSLWEPVPILGQLSSSSVPSGEGNKRLPSSTYGDFWGRLVEFSDACWQLSLEKAKMTI